MSVIIFYNCQIDAIKIKGIREDAKKSKTIFMANHWS